MLTIKATVDLRGLRSMLDGFSDRRYRSTLATALTRTAKIAQGEVVKEIGRVFDRPTRWALNSTYVQVADKDRLFASVWLKDRHGAPQAKETHYLYPEVFGVARGRKAYETALIAAGLRSNEFTVPAKNLALDANGNLPAGTIRTILSQLKVSGSAGQGYSSNKTDSARSKRTVAKRGTYFIPRPGSGLPRGIYRRTRSGSGWTTEMVLKIVVGKPAYRTRLRFFDISRRVQEQHLQREFDRAYDASAARLAARNAR